MLSLIPIREESNGGLACNLLGGYSEDMTSESAFCPFSACAVDSANGRALHRGESGNAAPGVAADPGLAPLVPQQDEGDDEQGARGPDRRGGLQQEHLQYICNSTCKLVMLLFVCLSIVRSYVMLFVRMLFVFFAPCMCVHMLARACVCLRVLACDPVWSRSSRVVTGDVVCCCCWW